MRRRDADLTYNLRAFADLPEAAPGSTGPAGSPPWAHHRSAAEVIVRQPDYLTAFAGHWVSENFADWQDWARWRLIRARASVLPAALVEEDFAFYGRTLSGTEQIRDRWKRGVSLVESLMGDAVGRLYVERHFRRSPRPAWTFWWPTSARPTG